MCLVCESCRSRGVAILINKETRDKSGRILVVLAVIRGHTVVFANAYAPNLEDQFFICLLECNVSQMGRYPVIMGMDFNQVWDPVLDRQPLIPRPISQWIY